MTQTTTETTPEAPKARGKTEKPNGHAGNGVATEPFPAPTSQPGEQGIATQEEDAPEAYTPPEPTQKELAIADNVFARLEDRDLTLAPEDAIAQLIGIVDVHKNLVTPRELFGGKDRDKEAIFEGAAVVHEIARLLCRRCPKLTAPFSAIGFFFKDHEKWTEAGQTVDAKVKRFDGFYMHITEGMKAAVIVNYHHWCTLNPRQKVFVVYHALRQLDEKGKRNAPDWVGYFEEPALFGAGVYKEMVTMAKAFVQDAPARAGEPFQLSILAGIYD